MKIRSVIILCGGKSTRMGFDKQQIVIDDELIVLNIASKFKNFVDEIIIVTNKPELYTGSGYKVVEDVIKGCGPMAGVYSGLLNSTNKYSYVVAGDMPFINLEYIRFLDEITNSNGYSIDVVAAMREGRVEPFHAVYAKGLCPVLYKYLLGDNYKLRHIIKSVNTRYISEEEVVRYDPKGDMFINLNTMSDLICYNNSRR